MSADQTSNDDLRTTDAVSRYLLPYPISSLYRLVYSSHEMNAQFGFSLRLVEGILRFLALTALADAMSKGAENRLVREWSLALTTPGMGKWLSLLKHSAGWLNANGGSFVSELAGLPGSDWELAADRIKSVRNRWSHEEVHVSNAEAKPLLDEIREDRRTVVTGIQFLRHYQLGVAEGLRKVEGKFGFSWYAYRGLEETCEPLSLKAGNPPDSGLPTLVSTRCGNALQLWPFFRWELAEGDQAQHLLWLHGIDEKGLARFRHPVLRQELVGGIPCTPTDDAPEAPAMAWFKACNWRPGRLDLALDERSMARLLDPFAELSFDDRFRVIGKLGEGGMGTVWEVDDLVLERRCALKVLRPEIARSPVAVRRFEREAKLLAKLEHPSIVQIHDAGRGPDHVPYILMEIVRGDTLHEIVTRDGARDVEQAVALMKEVLDGLAVIHRRGVVHRDIKPSNFIVSESGVRVMDFGIAATNDGSQLSRSMEAMGTMPYMAQEQLLGHATSQSDVFAAGRLLFYLLAGRPPRSTDEKLTDAAPAVPQSIQVVYARATMGRPDERFSSAEDFSAALQAGLELAKSPAAEASIPMEIHAGTPGVPWQELMRDAELSLAFPAAQAVHRAGVRHIRAEGDFFFGLFGILETIIPYASLVVGHTAGARSRSCIQRLAQDALRGGTLGNSAATLSTLMSMLGLPFAEGSLTYLIQTRNRLVHDTGIVTAAQADLESRRLVPHFIQVLESLRPFLSTPLFNVIVVRTGGGSYRAEAIQMMGALPNVWARATLAESLELGLYLAPTGMSPISVSPFLVQHFGATVDVLQLDASGRSQMRYRSALNGDKVEAENPEKVREKLESMARGDEPRADAAKEP